MTETLDRPGTTPTGITPAARVDAWLTAFSDALTARDVDRAAEMFAAVSFWRDLVSFSWNITTVEGPDGVRDLLRNTLDSTDPSGFTTTEEPTEDAGITTAWLAFETAVGRGAGLLRLQADGKAFTLLTTLEELKGHEEPESERRPMGAEHGVQRDRQTWLDRRRAEAEELGRTTQPYVVVVGGGQGGIALGARLRQLDVPTIVLDNHPRPGDQSGTTTCRT
jgi:putative flavoprotein involved in K+ transport